MQGGEPDVNAAAKMILNDFQRGKLPYFVKPPDMVYTACTVPYRPAYNLNRVEHICAPARIPKTRGSIVFSVY